MKVHTLICSGYLPSGPLIGPDTLSSVVVLSREASVPDVMGIVFCVEIAGEAEVVEGISTTSIQEKYHEHNRF